MRVDLAPLPAGGDPVTMTVAGSNSVTFTDVLVGDVWICSGQSNMEFNLAGARLWDRFRRRGRRQGRYGPGQRPAAPVLHREAGQGHRAGRRRHRHLEGRRARLGGRLFSRGLLLRARAPLPPEAAHRADRQLLGGTPAEAWTSLSGMKKEPVLQHYVQEYEKILAAYPLAKIAYPAKFQAYQTEYAFWAKNYADGYRAEIKANNDAASAAHAAGKPEPAWKPLSHPQPQAPAAPDGAPGCLYNGMISPLIPFALTGVIWYQGEANVGRAVEYRTLFARLITDWREKWGQGDFPFLFVQLASLSQSGMAWPLLRESQYKTLALPNTGMATAADVGDARDIHPIDKKDVGQRLALAARHVAYGEELVYSGPTFASAQAQGDSIRVSFEHRGGGLIIGSAPWGRGRREAAADDEPHRLRGGRRRRQIRSRPGENRRRHGGGVEPGGAEAALRPLCLEQPRGSQPLQQRGAARDFLPDRQPALRREDGGSLSPFSVREVAAARRAAEGWRTDARRASATREQCGKRIYRVYRERPPREKERWPPPRPKAASRGGCRRRRSRSGCPSRGAVRSDATGSGGRRGWGGPSVRWFWLRSRRKDDPSARRSGRRMSRSTARRRFRSELSQKAMAMPSRPARAVRPMR